MSLTRERLLDLLSYDEISGLFKWRFGRKGTPAGKIAGHLDKDGYTAMH